MLLKSCQKTGVALQVLCQPSRMIVSTKIPLAISKATSSVPRNLSITSLVQRLQGRLDRHFSHQAPGQENVEPVEELVDPDDPSGEKAIYKGILSTQIKLVKTFSLTTSAIGLAFQPVLYYHAQVIDKCIHFFQTVINFPLFRTPRMLEFSSLLEPSSHSSHSPLLS